VIVTDDQGAQAGNVKFDKKNDNSVNIDRLKVKEIIFLSLEAKKKARSEASRQNMSNFQF